MPRSAPSGLGTARNELQISSSPLLKETAGMDSMFLNVILVFVGSVIGSIGSSSIVLYMLKRRDKVEELVIHNNRLAEGMALQSEAVIMMLDAMHDANIVNGNGTAMKQKINDYLMKNTANGYRINGGS